MDWIERATLRVVGCNYMVNWRHLYDYITVTQLVDLGGLRQAFGIKVLRRRASADCRCGRATAPVPRAVQI